MSWYSKIYWLTRLDSLSTLLTVLLILGAIVLLFIIAHRFINEDDWMTESEKIKTKAVQRFAKRVIVPIVVFSMLGVCFIPTQKEMILIIAGGNVGEFVEKDSSLNKIPGQSVEYLSKLLQEQIDNLNKEVKDK